MLIEIFHSNGIQDCRFVICLDSAVRSLANHSIYSIPFLLPEIISRRICSPDFKNQRMFWHLSIDPCVLLAESISSSKELNISFREFVLRSSRCFLANSTLTQRRKLLTSTFTIYSLPKWRLTFSRPSAGRCFSGQVWCSQRYTERCTNRVPSQNETLDWFFFPSFHFFSLSPFPNLSSQTKS